MKRLRFTLAECIFAFFLLAFVLLFIVVEIKNGKLYTNDFRVYYDASRDFYSGNNPYEHAYGLSTGYFKYPPFTLYLFGLISWLHYDSAKMLHLTLLAGASLYAFIVMRRLANRLSLSSKTIVGPGWFYLAFVVFAIHLTRELHLGNVNIILVALFLAGINGFLTKRTWQASICWSLFIILKPIVIIALVPILLTKSWNVILKIFSLGIVFLLFPILHVGFSGVWELWSNWFSAAAAHGEYLTSNNTIANIIRVVTGFDHGWLVTTFLFLGMLFLMVREFLKERDSVAFLVKWCAVFLAFIPNIFITDTEHFLYSLPLVFLILEVAIRKKSGAIWSSFIIGMLCFSFHSSDLLGKDLIEVVSLYGLLGIGNLIFIGAYLLSKPLLNYSELRIDN